MIENGKIGQCKRYTRHENQVLQGIEIELGAKN